ncbi:hypothetical protein QJS10_CPA10g00266 [Acorus calamus]|uniref:DUF6821 domain-containing protein n=1 Tax=Acorus calamus TaxID=4465 RepID=A0AAV9E154_ACOCL|nr:hypothetical protein QJS10_CPA10g00266 [Acorus calamus]
MERSSIEMEDMEGWEILPDLLDSTHEDHKPIFNPKPVKEEPRIIGLSIKNSKESEFKDYPDEESVKETVIEELKEQESLSKVIFKKPKETEFADMKLNSPKSIAPIKPQIELGSAQFDEIYKAEEGAKVESPKAVLEEEKRKGSCWDGFGFGVWKWRINGIGGVCSIGVAAATLGIFILGGKHRQKQQHQKIQFEIYPDNQRIKQVVQQATRLNQAISGMSLTRANITFGGYYDGI